MKKSLLQSVLGSGTKSLQTVLALYFLPVSVIPSLLLSFYATRVFEESTRDSFVRRAASERDAIVGEIESQETALFQEAKSHSQSMRLKQAIRAKDKKQIEEALADLRPLASVRVFSVDGRYLGGRRAEPGEERISYISREGLRRVKIRGETLERFFPPQSRGFVTTMRFLIRDKDRLFGVLEEEHIFGAKDLADLKNRRGVDVIFLNREFTSAAASFALPENLLKDVSTLAFVPGTKGANEATVVQLGEARFATFLYDFPSASGKNKKWGYLAVFLSMTSADATVAKLKFALLYLTVLLILVVALLIFVFSKRLVRPIEALVLAMKRIKTGRVEQIPAIDSTYEIEYLVQSFNEMARNVSGAKRALELKLEELHRANQEIKNTQGTLVQSAKMISLGQLVAGVAHELNNPIAFIYSNMLHLNDYLAKIKQLVATFRTLQDKLPPEDRTSLLNLERAIDLDFILKDMEDLTRSCVEGATRTRDIVLGLRTFSRAEESSFRPADLHEGLRSTLKLLSTELKGRVTVHEEFGELPSVECNLSQMNQVFMNLLSNAGHAIEGRGDIWIRTRRENDSAIIEIEDNGKGISPEVLEKIFDPFFTPKKLGQGTGRGLSIAYGLVQRHHGSIGVRSQIGKGTVFTLRLPVKQPVSSTAVA